MRRLWPCVLTCLVACARTGLQPPSPDAGSPPLAVASPPARDVIERAQELRTLGHPDEAWLLLADAGAQAGARGDAVLTARTLNKQGDLAMDGERCEDAKVLYQRAFNLHLASGELRRAGLTANDLGLWSQRCDLGIYADEWFKLALKLRQETGDLSGVRVSASNLGISALTTRRYEVASSRFTESLEAARELGDAEGERKAEMNLALTWAMAATKDTEPLKVVDAAALGTARKHFALALEAARRAGAPDGSECAFDDLCPLLVAADGGAQ